MLNNINKSNKIRIIFTVLTICLLITIGLYKFFVLQHIKNYFESRKSVLHKVEKIDTKKQVSKPIATAPKKEIKKNDSSINNHPQLQNQKNEELKKDSFSDIKIPEYETKETKKTIKAQKREEKRKIKEEKKLQKELKKLQKEKDLEDLENSPTENINVEE